MKKRMRHSSERTSTAGERREKAGIKSVTNDTGIPGSIGFNEKEQKYYGWSHRAMYGFGIGDKVKAGDVIASEQGPKHLPVGFEAKTLEDAKRMAAAFADGVS